MRKKEEARQEAGRVLHVQQWNGDEKICEGGNKSGVYRLMKTLIEKGKK